MITIGVIGTGNMGAPMSLNLHRAGFRVQAYDIVEEKMEPLAQQGVIATAGHAQAVENAQIVLTMLPTGVEVRDVLYNHVFGHADRSSLLIDSSTIDPGDAREFHQAAIEKGYAMLDAPVSGGTVGAANGTLTFMVGGEPEALEQGRGALEAMGSRIIPCGGAGLGQAAKMCNNLMLGIQMASVAEGFKLAKKVGLDDEKLYEVASSSSGNCFALTTFCPIPGIVSTAPSSNEYRPGFSTDLMLKDMKLALAAAAREELALAMGTEAVSLYQSFSDDGNGGMDFSAIYRMPG